MFNRRENLDLPCPKCGDFNWVIGKYVDAGGGTRYPYFCGCCGEKTQLFEKKKIALKKNPVDVYVRIAEKRTCEVCGANGGQIHHWAPSHIFGAQSELWPTSVLCIPCHRMWHKMVTPNMCKNNQTNNPTKP